MCPAPTVWMHVKGPQSHPLTLAAILIWVFSMLSNSGSVGHNYKVGVGAEYSMHPYTQAQEVREQPAEVREERGLPFKTPGVSVHSHWDDFSRLLWNNAKIR